MMEEFYRDLAGKNMDALWRLGPAGQTSGETRAAYPPAHWRWSDIRPFMTRAADLVTPGPDSERRVVQLVHPSLPAVHAASHLMTANIQMVLPGEIAPPHRHTSGAIRFIIEGESAVTFVDGERVEMHPGDLVLTPAWHWHGHENHSSGPTLWMDTLDRPLTLALRQGRHESFPAGGQLLPRPAADPGARFPLLSYPWSETQPTLQRMAQAQQIDPFDDVSFEYRNPASGGAALPTIGCRIQMLRPGVRTHAHRHAHTAVYHVFRGAGSTIADGVRIDWQSGDFFTIPSFSWHEHHNANDAPAYLFSVSDAPILDALDYADEHEAYAPHNGHQPVEASYAERYGDVPVHA